MQQKIVKQKMSVENTHAKFEEQRLGERNVSDIWNTLESHKGRKRNNMI